ncbi:MAG: dihydroorotase [Paludibacter sp.]|jgi:dihydroorotase|nr:dihydroorotase [Paludibacter sp.]
MPQTLIHNATIINEGKTFVGSVLIENEVIKRVFVAGEAIVVDGKYDAIDASGKLLIAGAIDDQVHFREPGLTHKGDIRSESRAAVAGGITSFMDMPNVVPQTVTLENLEQKFELAAKHSFAHYSFYIGATNDNLAELRRVNPSQACGVKIFMGASTGNMLVDSTETLSRIFAEIPLLIAIHSEDEQTINQNKIYYRNLCGSEIPVKYHPLIRSAEACYKSTERAVALAEKYGARLHVLHLSTERELVFFDADKPLIDKKITAEVCVHHLWFSDADYEKLGNRIKWNPAIKTERDRNALREAIIAGKIDVVATDHAPHLWQEKQGDALKAASGGPLVQHSLVAMFEMVRRGVFCYETVVERMCHAPATLFHIERRGFIREGYFADLALINPKTTWTVTDNNILYKCGWSPFENETFTHCIETTWVNGAKVYDCGVFDESVRRVQSLKFVP